MDDGSTAGEAVPDATRDTTTYLTRSMMLRVEEDVVYCLQHTVIHARSVNPYGEGPESWCDEREHRRVYYMARKGDIDERKSQ